MTGAWPFGHLRPGAYAAIVADPPWRFRTWSKRNQNRSAERHYRSMPLKEILALPVDRLATKDCALFLWTLNSMMPEALRTIDAWGFTFKTVAFTWAKRTPRDAGWHMGLGYWTRQNSERCLLATRGKPKRLARDVSELLIAPRRKHSEKPDEALERVERLVAGPYVELFARRQRDGWAAWGDEIPADAYVPEANTRGGYKLAISALRMQDEAAP